MPTSISRFARNSAAVAASAALLISAGAAPAQAAAPEQTPLSVAVTTASTELSAALPPQVRGTLIGLIAFPVIGSSMLSSAIGIPQCGLHDTRAC